MVEAALELASTQSMRVSLDAIRSGKGGLDARRRVMLERTPLPGDWAKFTYGHLEMKDLAYLTAKTGHEFAILRGKTGDILVHGNALFCRFDPDLEQALREKRFVIYGHSHPGEVTPVPSPEDRNTLIELGQTTSKLISAMTGVEITFSTNLFDGLNL